MARTRYKPEEIVAKLRQLELLISQDIADAIRQKRQPMFDPEPPDPEEAKAKEVRLWSVILFVLFAIAFLIWATFWISPTGLPVPR